MNARSEIRSLGSAKRLKAYTQWSVNAAAVGGETLIADGVAKRLGWPLCKEYRPEKKFALRRLSGSFAAGMKVAAPTFSSEEGTPAS